MEYYDGRLCASMRELVGNGIMTKANYKQMAHRGRIEIARHGRGVGNYVLIVVDSLPTKYRDKVREVLGSGDEALLVGWLLDHYERDQAAVVWFYDRNKTGIDLKEVKKEEYIVNASMLNCIIQIQDNTRILHKLAGEDYHWEKIARAVKNLRRQFGHTLPTSSFRLRKRVAQYMHEGYSCLLSGKFGNQCAKKRM
ncbi:MAG: hypothetical protein J6C91_03475, partial [Muribaculaceae bacterium]|nr:hypothetical protein [Muribaculaceae bacterium]